MAFGQLKLISLSDVVFCRHEKEFVVSSRLVSKIPVEKFGKPHWMHSHETLLSAWYTASDIPIHFWWYHVSHESQQTDGVVHLHALVHTPLDCSGSRVWFWGV